jgi:hypothetical protein
VALDIEIQGLDGLQAAFAIAPGTVRAEVERAMHAALLSLIPELKRYPPPRPGQRYRRTKLLGRNWATAQPQLSSTGDTITGTLGNPTPYVRWVQDRERQAWMHKERWPTVQTILERNRANIEDYLRVGVDNALQRFT